MNRSLPLLAAGVAGTLLLTAAPAQAAPVQGGRASSGENVVRGAGAGTASADVDAASGAMDLRSTARGGQNLFTRLGLPFLGGPTTAGSSGSLYQRLGTYDAGTYDVVVTFEDARSSTETRGTGSASQLRSVFGGVDCAEDCSGFESVPNGLQPAGVFDEMPDGPRTVTSTITVRVPEGRTASLYAAVSVSASATAHRDGNTAVSEASVASITTRVVER